MLQVEGHQEDDRTEHGEGDGAAEITPLDVRAPQHPQRDQRVPGSQLDHEEQSQRHHTQAEGTEHPRAGPAAAHQLGDAVDRGQQADRDGESTGGVEAVVPDPLTVRQQPRRDQQHRHADRQVDQERPPPAEQAGEHSAENRPDGEAG